MIIVLRKDATEEEITQLNQWLQSFGVQTNPIVGSQTSVIGLVGDTSVLDPDDISGRPIVEKVIKVQEPYKKANRKFHPEDSVIRVGENIEIGGKRIVLAAGPCSIESEEQIVDIAKRVERSGASLLRGGAFKPRTSPYSFQGLKAEGLVYMMEAREKLNIPIVTEITNPAQIDLFEQYVDVIQVGTRNMQNFELMKLLGKSKKPILLKRGFANTIDELLMSAEYIMAGGNDRVILCERGIRTFETATRNTLDISAIPVLKRKTHLPVFVDPSHAGGEAWLVEPLSKAAIAAGADGLIIEVHNDPAHALSDGQQSLTPEAFEELVGKLRIVARAVDRDI